MRKWALVVSGWAFVGLAVLILLLPLKWVAAALVAAVIHESCHILAVRLCGGYIRSLSVSLGGAIIDTGPMAPWKEFLCILAGPLGGIIALLFVRWVPRIAVCSAMQSLYNLLPIYPLDGGRALRCISLCFLKPGSGDLICEFIETVCKVGLLFLAFYASIVRKMGLLPILIVSLILVKTKNGNSPCKHALKAVQ